MVFATKETPMQKIDFQRQGGKSKVAGYWSLELVEGGCTRLTLEMAVRPRSFLMWYMESTLRRHVPYGLISIRKKSLARLNVENSEDPEIIYQGEEGQEDSPPDF
jgi:hypothetical protein